MLVFNSDQKRGLYIPQLLISGVCNLVFQTCLPKSPYMQFLNAIDKISFSCNNCCKLLTSLYLTLRVTLVHT